MSALVPMARTGRPRAIDPGRRARGSAPEQCLSFASQKDLDAYIRDHVKKTRAEKQARKAEVRAHREAELGERTRAAAAQLGKSLYGLAYVDVPWKSEVWSNKTGLDRAPENHYPTMTFEEICALQIPVGRDGVLAFWVPASRNKQGHQAIEALGFDYRSQLVWRKPGMGLGYWVRDCHETLFICVRGDVPAPTPGTQPQSVIDAPRGRHSEKPAIFAEILERMFPTLPKIELFARVRRPGWDAWGNEAGGLAA